MSSDERMMKEPETKEPDEELGLFLTIIKPFEEWGDYFARLLVEPSRPDNVDWFDRASAEDEEIVVWENPSTVTLVPYVFFIILAYIALPVIAVNMEPYLGNLSYAILGAIPIISIVTLWELIVLKNTYYIITTHEIIKKTGVISTDVTNSMYSNVQNVNFTRSFYERILTVTGLFDIGDITIFTAGTDTSEIFLDNVTDPESFNSELKRFVTSYTMSGSQRHAGDDERRRDPDPEPEPEEETVDEETPQLEGETEE